MRTVAEQIAALETSRAAKAARMAAVMQKSMEEARSTDEAEQEEFDTLESEVEAIDADLVRFRTLERTQAKTAKPVNPATSETVAAATRSGIVVRSPKLEPGVNFARLVQVMYVAKKENERKIDIATR